MNGCESGLGFFLGNSKVIKRAVDVVGSVVAIVVLFLPMMAIGVVILVQMGRPVLFVQKRPGIKGRPFDLYKFRSMVESQTPDGLASPDATRITNFGKFCRRWSLDELPSLWNVLKGDMSSVGPRPLLVEYLPLYSTEQARRHEMRPGLTGLAQVRGRNRLDWPERLALDSWYVENWSLWTDFRIMLSTVGRVISGDGVMAPGDVAMSKFTGPGHDSADSGNAELQRKLATEALTGDR